jgi:hypothetical protein
MGEKWEAASGATAYNVQTIVAYFKLTLLPQFLFFFKFLGGRCCCRSCSCSRASIWMWRLDMDTTAIKLQEKRRGTWKHSNKKIHPPQKDSSVFGLPCTLCISHLSYSLIIHKLLSHLISLRPVLGGT